jgi:hypothetical protein
MSYYIILKPSRDEIEKWACIGMSPMFAAFFLESGDEGYDRYVAEDCMKIVYPEEGYLGKVDKEGNPLDEEDYKKWEDSLPREFVLSPFAVHEIKYEPWHTDEEIAYCFKLALIISHQNWLVRDLSCQKGLGTRVNTYLTARKYLQRIAEYKADWNSKATEVNAALQRSIELQNVDFRKVPNAELYSVK